MEGGAAVALGAARWHAPGRRGHAGQATPCCPDSREAWISKPTDDTDAESRGTNADVRGVRTGRGRCSRCPGLGRSHETWTLQAGITPHLWLFSNWLVLLGFLGHLSAMLGGAVLGRLMISRQPRMGGCLNTVCGAVKGSVHDRGGPVRRLHLIRPSSSF